MKIDVFEIVNSVTMVFPWIAWWRHRKDKTKHRRVHALLAVHVPVSMAYHALNSFCPKFVVTRWFKMLDIVCIHATSVAAAKDLMGVFPPKNPPVLYVATIPLHIVACGATVACNRDCPPLRFGLIVANNHTVFEAHKDKALQYAALSGSCFGSFHLSWKYPVGHGVFHALLYQVYKDFFELIEKNDHGRR